MTNLLKFIQSLFENPEIAPYVITALIIIIIFSFAYSGIQKLKEWAGIITIGYIAVMLLITLIKNLF